MSASGGNDGGSRNKGQIMPQQAARQDQFVSGLFHQIRLLELEVAYLKKAGQTALATGGPGGGDSADAAAAEGGRETRGARGEERIHVKQRTPTPTSAVPAPLTDRLREEMHSLRSELSAKSQRLESLSAENMQLQVRKWVKAGELHSSHFAL